MRMGRLLHHSLLHQRGQTLFLNLNFSSAHPVIVVPIALKHTLRALGDKIIVVPTVILATAANGCPQSSTPDF